jgi:hypothetical protein
MSDVVVKTPLQCLDSAMGVLRNLVLMQDKPEEPPIIKYHSVSGEDRKLTVFPKEERFPQVASKQA